MGNISNLIGKTLDTIQGLGAGSELVVFYCTDGSAFNMHHERD